MIRIFAMFVTVDLHIKHAIYNLKAYLRYTSVLHFTLLVMDLKHKPTFARRPSCYFNVTEILF
jgi:hypothetical protein